MQEPFLQTKKGRKHALRRAGPLLPSRGLPTQLINKRQLLAKDRGHDKQGSLASLYAILNEGSNVLSTPVNPDDAILGPATDRSILLDVFLQAFRPKGTKEEVGRHVSHSAIQYLSSIDKFSPILARAVASLCLAYFGEQSGDVRVTWSSQVYHGQVLSILREAISNCNALVKDCKPRDVLASIMLVGLYDEGTPSDQRSCQTWEIHLWGALQYLQTLGPKCLDLSDSYDLKLLRNLYGPALALCLARRKTLVFSLPQWTALRRKLMIHTPPTDYFAIIAKLPALLEQADILLKSGAQCSTGLCTDLLGRFACFENEIDVCLRATVIDEELCGVCTSDSSAFDLSIEEHIMITNSNTFDRFHRLHKGDKMAKVKTSTFCWLGLLLSESTVLRLLRLGGKEAQIVAQVRESRQRALDAADQLCHSVYMLSQLGSIAYAEYTCLLLQVAEAFYEDSGAARKMVWCQMCMSATKIRVERLRSVCPPTLCRIGDLADTLAAAVRCERIGAWGPPF